MDTKGIVFPSIALAVLPVVGSIILVDTKGIVGVFPLVLPAVIAGVPICCSVLLVVGPDVPDDMKGTSDVFPSVLVVIVAGSIVVEYTIGTVGVVPAPVVCLFSSAVGPIVPLDTRGIVGVFPPVLFYNTVIGFVLIIKWYH